MRRKPRNVNCLKVTESQFFELRRKIWLFNNLLTLEVKVEKIDNLNC